MPRLLQKRRSSLTIGSVELRNTVFMAPMSGITDSPFRKLAYKLGAGVVVTEMLASKQLAEHHPEIMTKTDHANIHPFVIQLAGREAKWMAEGARVCEALGADIIDINMGCPAKQVTSGLSGSALMRDLDHALTLIDAVISSVELPVTLKMRLGWDENNINAPELAKRAEAAGVKLVTVHGRTRCQFYKGQANWRRISEVKKSVRIPVIANGDIVDLNDVSHILRVSGADGVMIGRGACGTPWFPGQVAHFLQTGRLLAPISTQEQRSIIQEHYEDMLLHYGKGAGVRNARKHLAWYLEKSGLNMSEVRYWRSKICREDDPQKVKVMINDFYRQGYGVAA
ncbi:MAG: tRNA dihydrouridine synthase DusB [Pseudomonadota bacterium]